MNVSEKSYILLLYIHPRRTTAVEKSMAKVGYKLL